jgi:hypothetical protein
MIGNAIAGIMGTGAPPAAASSFESIATVTAAGSTVSFTSIPGTYKSLQIRGIAKGSSTSASADFLIINYNSDSGANYTFHTIYRSGATAAALGITANTYQQTSTGAVTSNASYANMYGVSIIDIIDYASTTKYKTTRIFEGADVNNSSYDQLALTSGLWLNTAAITSIAIQTGRAANFTGTFALYGIK